MIVDFTRARNKPNTIFIFEEEIEMVEDERYLGVHLDNRLN